MVAAIGPSDAFAKGRNSDAASESYIKSDFGFEVIDRVVLMIGTPISKERAVWSFRLHPTLASNGRKSRPVWPVTGSPKFTRMSALGWNEMYQVSGRPRVNNGASCKLLMFLFVGSPAK